MSCMNIVIFHEEKNTDLTTILAADGNRIFRLYDV